MKEVVKEVKKRNNHEGFNQTAQDSKRNLILIFHTFHISRDKHFL